MLRIEHVRTNLPQGFDQLRKEARADGFTFMDRLAADWEGGRMRFDGEGERLLAAFAEDTLAAVGGLTIDAFVTGALRMRRFYVRPGFRRSGLGRRLVNVLLRQSRKRGQLVVANAAKGSEAFWAACGFIEDTNDNHTHVLPPAKVAED